MTLVTRFISGSPYPEKEFEQNLIYYRRNFDKGNFRLSLGGNYSKVENDNSISHESMNASLGLGYEWFTTLSSRWQVYYGIEGRFGYGNFTSFSPPGSFHQAIERTDISYGISPLLGIRFSILPRLSFTSEGGLIVVYNDKEESLSSNNETLKSKSTRIFAGIAQPSLIALHFKF
jgi:hypothetical protein